MNISSMEISQASSVGVSFRAGLFALCLAVVWITLHPFDDLSAASYNDLNSGREFWTYALFSALAAVCLYELSRTEAHALRILATPANLALLAWIGVAVVTSMDAPTSLKRVTLLLGTTCVAASLFLLPRDRDELTRLLAVVAGLVLFLCYFGVVFLPGVSIHHWSDVIEGRLEGDWRGLFGHKNEAAGVCSVLVFIGMYVWRSSRKFAGAALALLAANFVLNSGGKSSTALCALTIVVSLAVERWAKARWSQAVLLLTPLALALTLGVGSALSPELKDIVGGLPIDESFTGREDIWRFAAEKIWDRPLFGQGFDAFWGTDAVRFDGADTTIWARDVAHAHNSYFDVALTMGLPGLALTLWAFVWQPLRDYHVAARGDDAILSTLMLRIWMFGIYLSSFDAVLFRHNDPLWMSFLFAVFSLRYLACFKAAGR